MRRNEIRKATKARKKAITCTPELSTVPLGAGTGIAQPRVHVIGLHHTVPDESFSHCAFTGKVLRFPDVLHMAGYHVTEYANGISHSTADEHVQIFTRNQLVDFFGEQGLHDNTTISNSSDVHVHQAFRSLVLRELRKRVQAGDVIAHVYSPDRAIVDALPDCVHVETGIGYGHAPVPGCYRIFESETWRAWHMGRYHLTENGGGGTFPDYPQVACTAVVPNYYDAQQWPLGSGQGWDWVAQHPAQPGAASTPYVFFAGRTSSAKGIEIVNWLAEQFPALTFVMASGEGRGDRLNAPNIHWLGRVEKRSELAAWYGGALCTLAPSRFHEPFGGVAVESLLCGTPVISSDWAAFTETVQEGDGLRCNDRWEFREALKVLLGDGAFGTWQGAMGREARRNRAQERFGYSPVATRYEAALGMFRRMHAEGLKP